MKTHRKHITKQLLEIISKAGRPVDCADLYRVPEAKKVAGSQAAIARRLSDLYRRKYLVRVPAHNKNSSYVQYAYSIPTGQEKSVIDIPTVSPSTYIVTNYKAPPKNRSPKATAPKLGDNSGVKKVALSNETLEVSINKTIRTVRLIFGDIFMDLRVK